MTEACTCCGSRRRPVEGFFQGQYKGLASESADDVTGLFGYATGHHYFYILVSGVNTAFGYEVLAP